MSEGYSLSRASACEGKQAFDSAKLAHAVARRASHHKDPRHAFHCQHCGLYHLATTHRGAPWRAKRPRYYEAVELDED